MSPTDLSKDFAPAAFDRYNVVPLHHDPVVRAGIVASLRQHAAFDVREDGMTPDAASMAVFIADYPQALQWMVAAAAECASPPRARILVLTSNDREADIRRAIEAGVHGYLLLGSPLSELVEAVTALAHGARYLGRSVAQRMADSLARASLTARETDVLRLVAAGESNKAIARQLHIEVGTVKTHVNAIMGKLDATSRTQATAIAFARGLVPQSPMPAQAYSPRVRSVDAVAIPT
jgi:two-component system NarL family response regulator